MKSKEGADANQRVWEHFMLLFADKDFKNFKEMRILSSDRYDTSPDYRKEQKTGSKKHQTLSNIDW